MNEGVCSRRSYVPRFSLLFFGYAFHISKPHTASTYHKTNVLYCPSAQSTFDRRPPGFVVQHHSLLPEAGLNRVDLTMKSDHMNESKSIPSKVNLPLDSPITLQLGQ